MNISPLRPLIPIILLGASLSSGCSTFVRGSKPSAKKDGVHYWLPMPILRATPNANGTLTVTPDSVPDTRHEYVVSARSLLGKYKFEVKVDKGLLTTVTMNGDTSDTPKSVVDAAVAIEKSRIAAERSAVEAREEAVKTREKAIKDATAKVLEKKRVVIKLRAERDAKIGQGFEETSDEIKAIDLRITDALSELTFAEEDLAALLAESGTGGNLDSGKSRHHDGAGNATLAWGPVIYRIEQWIDSDKMPNVRLVAANWKDGETTATQLEFQTAVTGNPVHTPPKTDVQMFTVDGHKQISPAEGKLRLTIDAKVELHNVEGGQVENASFVSVGDAYLSLQQGGKKILVDLPAGLADGRYYLTFKYDQEGVIGTAENARIEFSVKR
jgi:hypothetical protein